MRPPRWSRLMAATALAALTLTVLAGSGSAAQDGAASAGDAFCALLTTDEMGELLSVPVTAAADSEACTWTASSANAYTAATIDWTDTTIADHKVAWPGGEDMVFGERPAYYSPGLLLNELLIEMDPGVLYLMITGFDGDVREALIGLADEVLAREGSLPPPPQAEASPLPDATGADPVLESLVPTSAGGEAMTLSSTAGDSLQAMLDPAVAETLEGILAGQGKTIADLSIVSGGTPSGASILGVRVAGGDASAVAPELYGSMAGAQDIEEAPAQVAGKDVTLLTLGSETVYLYLAGDTASFVDAEEPALTEILTALP